MACHAVGAVTADTTSLRTIVIHPFLQPAGRASVGRCGMAGSAIQPRCDRRRNVVGYLGLGSAILQSLCRVGAPVADVTAGCDDQRMLHGSRRKSGDRRAIVFRVASVARDRSSRNMSNGESLCPRAVVAGLTVPRWYCRVINRPGRTQESGVIAGVGSGVASVAR